MASFVAAGVASAAATSTFSEFEKWTCDAVEAPSGLRLWAA